MPRASRRSRARCHTHGDLCARLAEPTPWCAEPPSDEIEQQMRELTGELDRISARTPRTAEQDAALHERNEAHRRAYASRSVDKIDAFWDGLVAGVRARSEERAEQVRAKDRRDALIEHMKAKAASA